MGGTEGHAERAIRIAAGIFLSSLAVLAPLPAREAVAVSIRGAAAALTGAIGIGPACLLIAMTFLWSPNVEAQEVPLQKMSLEEAVVRAVGYFPSIRASESAQAEAEAASEEAFSSLFPVLEVDGSATRYEKPMMASPIHGFAPGELPAFDRYLFQGAVNLNYTIFDGGGRRAKIRQARSQERASMAGLNESRQELISRVAASYLQVFARREIVAAHDRRLEALESERKRAETEFQTGRSPRVYVLRAEAAISSAKADRVRDAQDLDRSERELGRLIGVPADSMASVSLAPVSLTTSSSPPPENIGAQALSYSPKVEQARGNLAAATAGVEVAKSRIWPDLNLAGAYTYYGRGTGDFIPEWLGGVNLSYLLFDGGGRSKAVSRARAAENSAYEGLRLAEIDVEQQVDRVESMIAEAHARVESLQTAVARFSEVARMEKLSLESGAGTQTDFLSAEAELLVAQANLVNARHEEIAARIELARVAGQLSVDWIARNLQSPQ